MEKIICSGGWMIYVYMITTNYHSVLRPVVNIYFAVIVIKSQVREEEQRGDVRHCPPPASAPCSSVLWILRKPRTARLPIIFLDAIISRSCVNY